MTTNELTSAQAVKLGKSLREADDGNMVVGSFAAEIVGESYPFSKTMSALVFDMWNDEALGRKFAKWCDEAAAARVR